MTDVTTASDAGSEPTVITVPPAAPAAPSNLSVSDAARILASARMKPQAATPASPDASAQEAISSDAAATQETDLSTEDNLAPAEEQATEATTESEPNPEETPSLEPPRSWSKEARERWAKLDPDTQQYLLNRDREDSAAIRRAQNEAAEHKKQLEARMAATDSVRQQYEQALPVLIEHLQQNIAGEFADIKNWNDLKMLAQTDPQRKALWDIRQQELAVARQEQAAAQQRQQEEKASTWQSFAAREDAKFEERHPEIADPVKGKQLKEAAEKTLTAAGFSREELSDMWFGQKQVDLRDARMQELLLKAAKFDQAQQNRATAPKKPLPAPQRPGAARPAGAVKQQVVNDLAERFEKTGNLKDGVELLKARRSMGARR